MPESYKYLDPDYVYTDPNTGILRNIPGITDAEDLLFFESAAVSKRIKELYEHPIKIKGLDSLFEIHKYLFQDVYEWAGQIRKVEISKEGNQFFPTTHFENAFKYIDEIISKYKKIPNNEIQQIAEKLAEILDAVNHLHPFREGNGRTQREFIRLLALEKGYNLNLNPPDNKYVYEQYMKGTINGDVKILTNLILELLKK